MHEIVSPSGSCRILPKKEASLVSVWDLAAIAGPVIAGSLSRVGHGMPNVSNSPSYPQYWQGSGQNEPEIDPVGAGIA